MMELFHRTLIGMKLSMVIFKLTDGSKRRLDNIRALK